MFGVALLLHASMVGIEYFFIENAKIKQLIVIVPGSMMLYEVMNLLFNFLVLSLFLVVFSFK